MQKHIHQQTVTDMIALSRLLGEFAEVKRAVLLPNGESESDTHHSFVLALSVFEFANQFAPELDSQKLLLYSLVHDLPELVTGDMSTLTATPRQLRAKARRERQAMPKVRRLLGFVPSILAAVEAYEAKADDEALFVYWIDKMITIPTHFYDNGANLRAQGVHTRRDIGQWYERTLQKLRTQPREPHESAVKLLELAYQKMYDELLGDEPAEVATLAAQSAEAS
jgi:5'-deoxynucleotidase YfbR-like HD superfamily hydrolase